MGGWAARVEVSPGRNGDNRPYGSQVSTRFFTTRAWIEAGDLGHDYAVIELPADVGALLGTARLAAVSDAELSGFRVAVPGYPAERGGQELLLGTGRILSVSATGFVHSADTSPGLGGAPVFVVESGGREGQSEVVRCVGIHVASGAGDRAVRMTQAVREFIAAHMP